MGRREKRIAGPVASVDTSVVTAGADMLAVEATVEVGRPGGLAVCSRLGRTTLVGEAEEQDFDPCQIRSDWFDNPKFPLTNRSRTCSHRRPSHLLRGTLHGGWPSTGYELPPVRARSEALRSGRQSPALFHRPFYVNSRNTRDAGSFEIHRTKLADNGNLPAIDY